MVDRLQSQILEMREARAEWEAKWSQGQPGVTAAAAPVVGAATVEALPPPFAASGGAHGSGLPGGAPTHVKEEA